MSALIIVDMQKAIDDPVWAREGARNHKNAELAALRLLDSWRSAGRFIYHVRHDSMEPDSTYRPGQAGHDFKPGFEPRDGEALIPKHTGSAFTNTPLEALLRRSGQTRIVVAGVITNNSVETTVRHAGTLGFEVTLAEDACFTFGRGEWTAEEVHAMSLANLEGRYCRVSTSAEILAESGSRWPILPYFERPASLHEWDARVIAAAKHVCGLIERAEHIGSTAVPGCEGKGVIDLLVTSLAGPLREIGFQPQSGRDPFPEDRPMLIGAIAHGGTIWRIHAHVIQPASPEVQVLLRFRDRLRAEPALVDAYVKQKQSILSRGIRDTLDYALAKGDFIAQALS